MNVNVPALPRTVADLIEEYDTKCAALEDQIEKFNQQKTELEMGAAVQGVFVEPIFSSHIHVDETRLRRNLLRSGWKAIYNRLQIDRLASAKDKKLFEQAFTDPPPLTFDNAKATFGTYFTDTRHHLLKGVAEVFADLDPAYKSHSKVKIGVKGLPKRLILRSFNAWGSYGFDKFQDVVNALAVYRGWPLFSGDEQSAIRIAHRSGEDAVLDGRSYFEDRRYQDTPAEYKTFDRGLTVRKFQNGNAHVIFAADTLLDINRALAEFYGDALADDGVDDGQVRPSTEVVKDLQFYWTPKVAIDKALEFAGIYRRSEYAHNSTPPSYSVLEPSCGDGRILDELKERGCRVFGVEVHAGRAAEASAKNHSVLCANFLECEPRPEFDFVIMNPPFYGRHYVKHVRHALGFLKPGGTLVSILPATAHYDHKELEGEWRDLPVGSFSEAGTNVPTGMLKIINRN